MYMLLVLFTVFALTAGVLWMHGLWSNALTLISLILAMLMATNFFEPVAALADSYFPSGTYFLDAVSLWVLFLAFFGAFRGITDALSKTHVKFILPVEMAGRSILALWCGWLMVCFVAFSLHMAPLNSATPLGAWTNPMEPTFLGFAPDRMWLGFMQQNSRGYLSRGKFSSLPTHPNDAQLNVETFDPQGEFLLKYAWRRKEYAKLEGMTP
ncbi:hypothetical protein [Anatilimnocola floriformis]|uniref:hypothetical protein n=1 Tax=Anatilimnocola floriformis TaxID=2948575 RepID=UPI0020C4E024|nr:hypothetical protein [Anatilimnocola floriformis]